MLPIEDLTNPLLLQIKKRPIVSDGQKFSIRLHREGKMIDIFKGWGDRMYLSHLETAKSKSEREGASIEIRIRSNANRQF